MMVILYQISKKTYCYLLVKTLLEAVVNRFFYHNKDNIWRIIPRKCILIVKKVRIQTTEIEATIKLIITIVFVKRANKIQALKQTNYPSSTSSSANLTLIENYILDLSILRGTSPTYRIKIKREIFPQIIKIFPMKTLMLTII